MPSHHDILNQPFTNTEPVNNLPAVITVPFAQKTYIPVIEHTAFQLQAESSRRVKQAHSHDVYHIVLVNAGRGAFLIGDELCPVERGDLFLTSPGVPHSFEQSPGETTEYCEVTFALRCADGAVLQQPLHEVIGAWLNRPCTEMIHAEAAPGLYGLIIEHIEELVRTGFSGGRDLHLQLNVILQRIWLGLYQRLLNASSTPMREKPLPVARRYLHQHYAASIRLGDLAAHVGLTANYLSRRFKQEYGATPIVYQHRLRIQAACSLLTTTDFTLERIATIVGFEDSYYFSRRFKKIQGIPPGRYRKTSQG